MASNILRNVEKFENQEWKFPLSKKSPRQKQKKIEEKLFSFTWLQSEKVSFIKKAYSFLPVCAAHFSEQILPPPNNSTTPSTLTCSE